jgi:hypothetical protein
MVDDSYPYNAQKVQELTLGRRQQATNPSGDIVFMMTTCKRVDQFFRTMDSILCTMTSLDRVAEWIVVDDMTASEDRIKMQDRYPFMTFIWKSEEEKGHARSLNIMREQMLQLRASRPTLKYILHVEDDFLFVRNLDLARVVNDLENHGVDQLRLNGFDGQRFEDEYPRFYSDYFLDKNISHSLFGLDAMCTRGWESIISNPPVVVEHVQLTGETWQNYLNSLKHPTVTNAWWHGYSFRPPLMRADLWEKVGPFDEQSQQFEIDYSVKAKRDHNVRVAYYFGMFALHIGKHTDEEEEDVPSAYRLNNVGRWGQ